jgi:hypothetical protein
MYSKQIARGPKRDGRTHLVLHVLGGTPQMRAALNETTPGVADTPSARQVLDREEHDG